MNEDDEALIEALLARVGAMLEDASAVALLRGERSRVERIELLTRTLRDVGSLVSAARSLTEEAGS